MKLAIMQPYFMPYIGYFQLIAAVDQFVVYDNIKYTKKGWINRNRLLLNGKDEVFSIPLKKGSDALDVRNRELATEFDRRKLLNQIHEAYRQAPQFRRVMPAIEEAVGYPGQSLFEFLFAALKVICRRLDIGTELKRSSSIEIDHTLKGEAKVLALCHAVGALTYVNAIGGQSLYSADVFKARGIELRFLSSRPVTYSQFGAEFVPSLSIIDVMMFNSVDEIRTSILSNFDLV